MAPKQQANNNNPMYEPMMPPVSRLPFGMASSLRLYQYTKVGSRAKMIRITAAMYLASTSCISVSGFVSSNSIVPVRRSSLKLRMVTAGTRKRKTHGAMKNSGARSA